MNYIATLLQLNDQWQQTSPCEEELIRQREKSLYLSPEDFSLHTGFFFFPVGIIKIYKQSPALPPTVYLRTAGLEKELS